MAELAQQFVNGGPQRMDTVKQRTVPNLRQVHLIHAELFDELVLAPPTHEPLKAV